MNGHTQKLEKFVSPKVSLWESSASDQHVSSPQIYQHKSHRMANENKENDNLTVSNLQN